MKRMMIQSNNSIIDISNNNTNKNSNSINSNSINSNSINASIPQIEVYIDIHHHHH